MAYADNNRLAQVKLRASGGDTVVGDYSYDGKGQRATKTSGGVTSHFVYGPNGELIGEYKSTGELVSEFIYLNGQPVAVYAAQTETLPPTPPIDLIVDNDAAGTSSTGSWAVKTNANDYGANYREGDSTDTYRWTPSPISGTFEVYAWWVANSKYSKVANYTISHTGASDVVVKSHAANGGAWQLLGTYVLNGSGTEYVQLHAADGKKIGADAIRFKQLGAGSVTVTTVGTYFIHADHLGTPRRVSNDLQTIIWRWDSRPFGETVPNEDPDGDTANFVLNLRFPGQYFDAESALNYNYFRDYDPGTGRYIESDPIGLRGGPNTFGHAFQNPIMQIDPSGLEVRFACRELSGLGGLLTDKQHCFVVVTCPAENWEYTFSLFGADALGLPSYGYKEINDPRDQLDSPATVFNEPINQQQCFAEECAFEKAVVDRWASFPARYVPYSVRGPNSNSFANDLATGTHYGGQLPPGAPGPDIAPGIDVPHPDFP